MRASSRFCESPFFLRKCVRHGIVAECGKDAAGAQGGGVEYRNTEVCAESVPVGIRARSDINGGVDDM